MEIEEILKYLKIANDIHHDELNVLESKYFSDKEKATKFVEDYYKMAYGRTGLAFEKHAEMKTLIDRFNNKYLGIGDPDRIERLTRKLEVNIEEGYNIDNLFTKLGFKGSTPTGELLSEMLKAGECYYRHSDENFEGISDLYKRRVNNKTIGNPEDIVSLCNNTSFLYFANLVLTSCDDIDNFVNDVQNIINVRHDHVRKEGLSLKEKLMDSLHRIRYRRVAAHTEKLIAAYDDRKALQDPKRLKNVKE